MAWKQRQLLLLIVLSLLLLHLLLMHIITWRAPSHGIRRVFCIRGAKVCLLSNLNRVGHTVSTLERPSRTLYGSEYLQRLSNVHEDQIQKKNVRKNNH